MKHMKKLSFGILFLAFFFGFLKISVVHAEEPELAVDNPLQQLHDNFAMYRCQFIDCEKESDAVFGSATSDNADALASLSDFQTVTSTKRDEQVKAIAELTSLREYKLSQAQLAAGQNVPAAPCETGKCILVVISRQMTYAYENGVVMNTTAVSTGVRGHNTPTGTYRVYGKTASQKMSGPGYYLPHVPYILWWHGDYSIHGTYWHHNFGHPMSHGCVNMPTPTAKWYFDWAPVGTPVIIRSS
jgi:lipoprotein-anchoring transpeptidase ErfK/SrfK